MTVKNISLLFLLLFIFGMDLQCQLYNYSFKERKVEFFSSLALWGGAQVYRAATPFEAITDLEDLDRSSLWGIDRKAVFQNSYAAKKWSDVSLYASLGIPTIALLLDKNMRSNSGPIIVMGLEGLFLTGGLTQISKSWAERPRPYVYRMGESALDQNIGRSSTESFISGHTSTVAYFSFYTARILTDYHPDSPLKPLIWGVAATIPALTGYLRYKAGRHFPTDVTAGYFVGAAIGFLVPTLYKSKHVRLGMTGGMMSLTVNLN